MSSSFLLYGATGYTGELIARAAVGRGLRPVLGGRNGEALKRLGDELGLDARVAPLTDAAALARALDGLPVVLHCAGPFVHTSAPMADACLAVGVHYLDITGEIPVFEALAARDAEARARGVMLLPGVSFDVVPTDTLSAHVKRRLPSATRLELGVALLSSPSRGTAATMLEALGRGEGAIVRRGGRLEHVPLGASSREIDFGDRRRRATLAAWGDVATAWYSTGIPEIDVYMVMPAAASWGLPILRVLAPALRTSLVAGPVKALLRTGPAGPSARERAAGQARLWARASDPDGREAIARMRTPEGYDLTVTAALWIVEQVLAGRFVPGFQTPSRVYGADFVLGFDGVVREDLPDNR